MAEARLFVAAWPPPHVIDLIAALPRPAVEGLRWTGPDQWHVTLRFLGRCEIEACRDALRGAVVPTATAVLGPVTDRFGRRILHVPVGGLAALATVVVQATVALGEPPEDRPFSGHVTIGRARTRQGVDLRPLCGTPVAASWPVTEVALVASHLGGGPARYETVEVFPVAAEGA